MTASKLPFLAVHKNGLLLSIYVQPRASRNQICGIVGDELKIRLTSPPVDGAANKLCREFIAELFNTSKSSVEIVSGETSRHKRLLISADYSGQFDRAVSSLEETLSAPHTHTERI